MFKAFIPEKQDFFILLDLWPDEDAVNPVRKACDNMEIVCPECGSRLTPKAGPIRIWHFAHHVNPDNLDCSIAKAAKKKRLQIAVMHLYLWLKSQNVEALDVEVNIPGINFFKPFDCYYELNGKRYAVAIIDTVRNWCEVTDSIKYHNSNSGITIIPLILPSMKRDIINDPEDCSYRKLPKMKLTKMERYVTKSSEEGYERCYAPNSMVTLTADSLHFIVPEKSDIKKCSFVTIRGIDRWNGKFYQKVISSISDIRLDRAGDFVHPGEGDLLIRKNEELRIAEEEDRIAENKKKAQEKLDQDEWGQNFVKYIQEKKAAYRRNLYGDDRY